jgi:DNA-binding response OmpR family regulator
METLIPPPSTYPSLLFDPDFGSASSIAHSLECLGVDVTIARSSLDALRLVSEKYHRVVIVIADLANESCLAFLDSMHRTAPRSWLVVANPKVDDELKRIAYHHGADALVGMPVDAQGLAERIAAFQARARPLY